MLFSSEPLGELLVGAGLITCEVLEAALMTQSEVGGKLGQILVRDHGLTEFEIARALAEQKGLPHVDLSSYQIDPSAAMLLPLRFDQRQSVIPIALEDGVMTLAMADPLDVEAIDEAGMRSGFRVEPVVATTTQVVRAIERYVADVHAIQELEVLKGGNEADGVTEEAEDAGVAVVRMINQLIRTAVLERASDVHFEPEKDAVRVRSRVDGVLREAARLPKASQSEILSRVKVMADLDISERRRPQDGRITVRVEGRTLDVRVATLPTPNGEAITLRILDSGQALRGLDSTGLGPDHIQSVRSMLRRPYGMIFVSGPTGSGKSTTLYAALNEINDPTRKIISVEDPIEYSIPGITQIAVNPGIGLTFASGLRTILRSDPDVVMVGEVRDPDTAEMAVRAALTGHLVLSSIHTNDAPSALTRLNDMGVPPYITASALTGVIAQRLVRRLCTVCKAPVEVSSERRMAAGLTTTDAGVTLFGPVGCEACEQTGFSGRVGVFEIMELTDELRTLCLQNATAEELRCVAEAQGMRALREDALAKVAEGLTSLDEVDRVVV